MHAADSFQTKNCHKWFLLLATLGIKKWRGLIVLLQVPKLNLHNEPQLCRKASSGTHVATKFPSPSVFAVRVHSAWSASLFSYAAPLKWAALTVLLLQPWLVSYLNECEKGWALKEPIGSRRREKGEVSLAQLSSWMPRHSCPPLLRSLRATVWLYATLWRKSKQFTRKHFSHYMLTMRAAG